MGKVSRLSVLEVLSEDLSFAGSGYFKVLKVSLAPFVLFLGPSLVLLTMLAWEIFGGPVSSILEHGEMEAGAMDAMREKLLPALKYLPLIFLGTYAFSAVVITQISRFIVLEEKVRFVRLDRIVGRVLLGELILSILPFIFLLFVMIGFSLIVLALSHAGLADSPWMKVIPILGAATLLYLVFRFALLLVDIAVTGEIRLLRAFRLTWGYTWQLFGTLALVLLGVALLGVGVDYAQAWAVEQGYLGDITELGQAIGEKDFKLFFERAVTYVVGPVGFLLVSAYILATPFLLALEVAVPALVYREIRAKRGAV